MSVTRTIPGSDVGKTVSVSGARRSRRQPRRIWNAFVAAGVVAGGLTLATVGASAQVLVKNAQDLQNMNGNLAGAYVLANDIDASQTATWLYGQGLTPIGSFATPFTGVFNGNGHVISHLHINSTLGEVGLFGDVGRGGVVMNVGLTDAVITASVSTIVPVGALVGGNYGLVSNTYMTGSIIGADNVTEHLGGLVGENWGTVTDSHAAGTVSGEDAGGLVGFNDGVVASCYATASVKSGAGGYAGSGGLVANNYGVIRKSYATGRVAGTYARVGGLVGFNEYGSISDSFASGPVYGYGTIPGAVFYVGGLVGENNGPVATSFSVGKVSGVSGYAVGGLIGGADASAAVTYSYWDTSASGIATSAGGTPHGTTHLKAGLPLGFNGAIWSILPTLTYPYLPLT